MLTSIYSPEEQRERASKTLRLNGGPDHNPDVERLLAASSVKKKPTVRITRLKVASSVQERIKAEKASRLEGAIEISIYVGILPLSLKLLQGLYS